jgi:formate/nitrite transporter FocA (FNT family)
VSDRTDADPAGSGDLTAEPGERGDSEVEETFDKVLADGRERLDRPFLPLLSTGLLGGVDVGVGVLTYLVVKEQTGSTLLAALGFTVGFVAPLLANSELFTENFLVPVIAVVTREGSVGQLLRLWAVSLGANLLGGLAMAAMIVEALPSVRETAIETGQHYAGLGTTWRAFFLAVLAGAVITLLTRMQTATDSIGAKLVAAVTFSFVLVGTQLFHSVLDSIFLFAGLLTGHAPYGWLTWLNALWLSALGNILGGVVLVTSVRLLRVGHRVEEQRAQGPAR